ncbi:MAG: beta-lactamase family protein [Proteobacteria bacterium]|nr:beta-lactamase family protein [Pseudomonadota bacterium]
MSKRSERVGSEVARLMEAGVSGQVFPGGVACISWREEVGGPAYADVAAGRLQQGDRPVQVSTTYDLASVTKPFVAVSALRMVAQGRLSLAVRTDSVVPDTRGGIGGAASLEALLTHRSGLAGWGGLYLDVPHDPGTPAARRWILSEASRRSAGEGEKPPVYSDLGYIIAGEVVARSAGERLERVVSKEVLEPLGLEQDVFYPPALAPDRRVQLLREAPPTEWCDWRQRIIRGEAHDENCAAFGGVAGNAGLFGTARGVAIFGRAVLDAHRGVSGFLPQQLLRQALAPRPGSTLRLGWDGKAAEGSASGRRMSDQSFGHLGFTGTSLWCDPDKDLVVVLLTNRVHPSRANERIKGFRPGFHDGVVAALGR